MNKRPTLAPALVIGVLGAMTAAREAGIVTEGERLIVRVRDVLAADVLALIVSRTEVGIAAVGDLDARVVATLEGLDVVCDQAPR